MFLPEKLINEMKWNEMRTFNDAWRSPYTFKKLNDFSTYSETKHAEKCPN